MNLILHIATLTDWTRGRARGAYVCGSLANQGFVHCSTGEQYLGVANAMFTGRRDLVLLLIDAGRLRSELRHEAAEPGGAAFPHVYGPLELDAIFEAVPLEPGSDGRFEPVLEVTSLLLVGADSLAQTTSRARAVMRGAGFPWWIAGGWGVDVALGRRTRPHADLEVSVLRRDQQAIFEHLRGWQLRLPPGDAFVRWEGAPLDPERHQIWAARGPRELRTPAEFVEDPTLLDILVEQSEGERWVFRRQPSLTRPLSEFGSRTAEGVPFVRPEIALLFKAKHRRHKDERDLESALPALDASSRSWLASALDVVHPGHPWRSRL